VARGGLVNEMLEDSGVEHGKTSDEEPGVDALDGTEVDALLAEEGVDDIVENGDHDDDGNGVQVSRGNQELIFKCNDI